MNSLKSVASEFSERFPDVARQLQDALGKDPKEPEYEPGHMEIYFDGIRVLRQEGKSVVEQRFFDPNYSPLFIFIYGDGELLLVKARGHLFLNRLPNESRPLDWKVYELNQG
ncbi:MAG: hypothetical protein D6694_07045 [Gammaproteobacteria bacterium]|nr:MAG: hypothetical protein D6694_07045 [Gammaproteobacteria bacterium]